MQTDSLIICRKCGRSIPADSERCDQCGAPVTNASRAAPAQREWIIGNDPLECQIHVDRATVSRRHCALRLRNGDYYVEDLNSSNKTYVNGQVIYGEVKVSRDDKITLGKSVDFGPYWPAEAMRSRPRATTTISTRKTLSIGRGPQNDIVLNRPRVSWKHAELTSEKGKWTLADAGSTHGTAVGSPSNKITSQLVGLDDIAFFGEFSPEQGWRIKELLNGRAGKLLEELQLTKTRTIVGRGPECDIVLDHPSISKQHAELIREGNRTYVKDLGSLNGTFVEGQAISGTVLVPPNRVIALGIFTLALTDSGTIEKAEYNGDFVLSVEGLAVQVGRLRLLEDVSFTFLPQEVIALMGGSGAGKTTLLKSLCGYTRPASGQILYNGRDLYANYAQFRHLIGYVPQDDIMHPELKVQEALLFAVMLRTGQDRMSAMKDVESVLSKLDLSEIRNHVIGSPMRKVISGGQRKRVNIAMELLCRPSCLFLDEPTSGLSSEDAEKVVGVLQTLAREGKTVVMTIHQPSREIFEMFSGLVMLKRDKPPDGQWIAGRRVYFGPAYPDSLEFFNPEQTQERRNSGAQPSPELLFEKLKTESAEIWEKRYLRSKYRSEYIDDRRDVELTVNPTPAPPRRRPLKQAWLLLCRNVLIKLRDPMQRAFFLLQPLLFGGLIAALFYDLNDPKLHYERPADYLDFQGIMATVHFLMAIAAVWFGCNSAVREIVSELPIYIRERMACLATRNYVLSKYVLLGALCFLQCLAMLSIVYVACRLQGSFWFYLGMTWLTSLVGVSIGLAVSALAALFKAPEAAVAALPLILLPMILLGGGVYPLHMLEHKKVAAISVSKLVSPVAPTRWVFEADFEKEAQGRCNQIINLSKQDKNPNLNLLAAQCQQEGDEPGQPKDLASNLFPTGKRSPVRTCLLWLSGLFAAFLIATVTLLRWVEKQEVG